MLVRYVFAHYVIFIFVIHAAVQPIVSHVFFSFVPFLLFALLVDAFVCVCVCIQLYCSVLLPLWRNNKT